MKVRELIEEIWKNSDKYQDFLEWDVYIEVIDSCGYEHKKETGWKFLTDSEDWEYVECAGYWTKFPKEKAFTINADY